MWYLVSSDMHSKDVRRSSHVLDASHPPGLPNAPEPQY